MLIDKFQYQLLREEAQNIFENNINVQFEMHWSNKNKIMQIEFENGEFYQFATARNKWRLLDEEVTCRDFAKIETYIDKKNILSKSLFAALEVHRNAYEIMFLLKQKLPSDVAYLICYEHFDKLAYSVYKVGVKNKIYLFPARTTRSCVEPSPQKNIRYILTEHDKRCKCRPQFRQYLYRNDDLERYMENGMLKIGEYRV